ncbi:pyruvate ferredoxin oxidoreductase [Candidatus Falkowbacteria bacterium CG23_combo_of_CG06-09_8_20_14_all_49_15]|uniref:Pyruvate ferredoxin oxidoreductase n=1 Tax=Candidatus Falkowbacteria bacterium CG23_combo_of_CG06-09_8_20_14_all_49_15 TaxID=1974572 RepID=A0A2G9ZJS7_9BACT|nr:MAG: pyruvate ferredoxin oxidoreductase [Candidatus Falkowbacteria bacterium CG23_combo_of_CG06-09_8_20_14_all_49_15]
MPKQILEGSRAVALTIKNIKPAVVSAYPITPQTHIVEDLAKFKSDGEADYEYVRAESEFAAASIVAGASAAGARVYTATSSQGLLLMAEVVYNIAGLRLPVVMTCANRGVSAPITIWNDHQDAMAVRDAGWIMLFAENHQEAVAQHVLAYKLAEQTHLPAMVNMDGFVLTHSYEPVVIPDEKLVRRFLGETRPAQDNLLDPAAPKTSGAFAAPTHYLEIRQALNDDLEKCLALLPGLAADYAKLFNAPRAAAPAAGDNGLLEYYGPRAAKTVIAVMGSLAGTAKDAVDEYNRGSAGKKNPAAVLKIKCYRPFPRAALLKALGRIRCLAVVEKAVSLGSAGPLALDIMSAWPSQRPLIIADFIVGLGGRDVTQEKLINIIKQAPKNNRQVKFIS